MSAELGCPFTEEGRHLWVVVREKVGVLHRDTLAKVVDHDAPQNAGPRSGGRTAGETPS